MGEKIRILMTLGTTSREGAQTYSMSVLRNIDRGKFQIDFAVNYRRDNGYESEMEQLGSEIHIIPKFKGINYFRYIKAVDQLLGHGKYQIVHGHVSSSAVLYLKEAKKFGCATIAHSHSAGYRGSAFERIVKKLFTIGAKKYADYWFACAEPAAIRMFGRNYRQYPNYYDMPNAIDTSRYLFDPVKRKSIRASLQIEEDAIIYGHVGSFSAPKNHDFLIDVFAQIYKEQGEKAYLVLVGDGALRKQIEQKVEQYGLQEQIIFTGIVGNVNEYMMAMDALIFPSLFEGVPLTLIEAQAVGLYSVVSDSIANEVNLTECIVPVSLKKSAAQWAEIVQRIPKVDRAAMNQIMTKTKYNIRNSIDTLTSLYEEMNRNRNKWDNK